MLKVGDSVYADKHAKQEFVVVAIDGNQVTAVEAGAKTRISDMAHWYDINGELRWKEQA